MRLLGSAPLGLQDGLKLRCCMASVLGRSTRRGICVTSLALGGLSHILKPSEPISMHNPETPKSHP